jgi:hypothetical protein
MEVSRALSDRITGLKTDLQEKKSTNITSVLTSRKEESYELTILATATLSAALSSCAAAKLFIIFHV